VRIITSTDGRDGMDFLVIGAWFDNHYTLRRGEFYCWFPHDHERRPDELAVALLHEDLAQHGADVIRRLARNAGLPSEPKSQQSAPPEPREGGNLGASGP